MIEQQQREHWKWDKHVNVGHVITTLVMVVSVFTWVGKTDQRIAILEERIANSQALTETLNAAVAHQMSLMRDEFRLVREELSHTNSKLDRFIENQANNRRNGG